MLALLCFRSLRLGAGRGRVLAHFLTEAGVLAAVSALMSIAVAMVATRLLVSAGPSGIPRLAEVHVDATVAAFTIVVAALVALACSAFPAIRFVRGNPLAGLRDGGRGGTVGGRRQRTRGSLVVAQVALALVVLAASGLLLRSYQRLHAVRPGFDADGEVYYTDNQGPWRGANNLGHLVPGSFQYLTWRGSVRISELKV